MKKKQSGKQGNLAVVYARYSSHNQRDVSIDQQVKAINEFADRQQLKVISVYADRALSGTTDNRPEFQRMIEDSKAGAFQYVIVYSMDRFARDRFDSITYKKVLKDNGVRVLSAMENISDDPSGILLESVLEGLAEYYSRELSQKIKRGLQDNAEKGLVAASIPFGYMKGPDGKYAIHPEESVIVKEIFDRVLHKESYIDIARDLNERGIRTKTKTEWNRSSFKFLTNERYMGIYIYRDIRREGGMPALVDPETFYAVQAEVERRNMPQGQTVNRRRRENTVYLLTGKCYCECCKGAMVGKSGTGRHGGFYTYYACRNQFQNHTCDMKQVKKEGLEEFVAGALRLVAMDDEAVNMMVDMSIEAQQNKKTSSEATLLRTELKQTESAYNNILKAIEDGFRTPGMKDRMAELSDRQDKLRAQIAILEHNDKQEYLTRGEILAAFQLLRENEITNKDFQDTLFDIFLNSVHVGKEKITIVMKFRKNGSSTFELPFDPENIPDVEGSHKRIKWSLGELMQTPATSAQEVNVSLRLYHNLIVIEIPRVA